MTGAYSPRYTLRRGVRNLITCVFRCHGKRCHCGYASPQPQPDPKPEPVPAPAKAPRAKSTKPANVPNPDVIYAPGSLPDEPATPDTPNGTPAGPISLGPDGEPLIPLRLANRYFMLLWGAILRGLDKFPDARVGIFQTLSAYSRFYPGPFATGP